MNKPDYQELSQGIAEATSLLEQKDLAIRDTYEAVEVACNLLSEFNERGRMRSDPQQQLWDGAMQAMTRALKTLGREIEDNEQ